MSEASPPDALHPSASGGDKQIDQQAGDFVVCGQYISNKRLNQSHESKTPDQGIMGDYNMPVQYTGKQAGYLALTREVT